MKIKLEFNAKKVLVNEKFEKVANAKYFEKMPFGTVYVVLENGERIDFHTMREKGLQLINLRDYNYHWFWANRCPEFAAVIGFIKPIHIQRLKEFFKQ